MKKISSESINELFKFRLDSILNDIEYNELIKLSNIIKPNEILNSLLSSNRKEISLCEEEFQMILNKSLEFDLWALKIIDSWGKALPSGLLKGNVFWTGNYDECIEELYLPNNKTYLSQPFHNQYCTLYPIKSSTKDILEMYSSITIGMCYPSSCNKSMITMLTQIIFNSINITENNIICSNDLRNGQKGLTNGAIATCFILSLLAFIVFIGTISDLIIKNSSSSSSKLFNVLIFLNNFSLKYTLKRIFTLEKNNDNELLLFINGIRVISLFWIIIGHSLLDSIIYTSNIIDVLSWSKNIFFQIIINATFSVDTFFVLSGFLTTILFVKEVKKTKLTYRLMIIYYIHRYIRLTPSFLLLLLISINLTAYFGSGPFYPIENGFESNSCRNSYWWTSILYIGNLIEPHKMCFGISWYLYNDMQFHWIAPLALIPFVINQKFISFIITILFILIGIFSILGILLYYPNMSINTFDEFQFSEGINFFNKIYVVPWCRISSYAVGMLTAFILLTIDRTYRLNIYIKIMISLLSFGIILICIFSIYKEYANEPGLNRNSLIVYQCLSRTGWSLSIGWIIYLCYTNQGGIINQILSWSIWLPFSKVNYGAFLIHPTILYIIIFNRTVPFYFQGHILMNNFVSHIFYSYAAAILVYSFLETPFIILEKQLFKLIKNNKISN